MKLINCTIRAVDNGYILEGSDTGAAQRPSYANLVFNSRDEMIKYISENFIYSKELAALKNEEKE